MNFFLLRVANFQLNTARGVTLRDCSLPIPLASMMSNVCHYSIILIPHVGHCWKRPPGWLRNGSLICRGYWFRCTYTGAENHHQLKFVCWISHREGHNQFGSFLLAEGQNYKTNLRQFSLSLQILLHLFGRSAIKYQRNYKELSLNYDLVC